ncbi:hypothetical protein CR513_17963, partial [Mucuna pruriens]
MVAHECGHLKRNYLYKKKDKKSNFGDVSIASDGYEFVDTMMATNNKVGVDWVLDLECFFHVCLVKE